MDRVGRSLVLATVCAAVVGCSLLVDTNGLDGAEPTAPDAASDAPPEGSAPPPAPSDAGADVVADAGGSRYASAILADAPIAYYRMGSGKPNAVRDERGGADLVLAGGTTTGAPGALAGDDDRAIAFDGTNGYGQADGAGGRFDFAGHAPFTIELWAARKTLPSQSYYQHLVGDSQATTSARAGFIVYMVPAEGHVAIERDCAGGNVGASAALFAEGGFHHVAAVYDGTNLVVYVDGSAGPPSAASCTMPARGNDLFVGIDHDLTSPLSGAVDEVALYDRVLTKSDLLRHIAAAQ